MAHFQYSGFGWGLRFGNGGWGLKVEGLS